MSERITVTDPKIKELEDRCIRELDEFYPNHIIEQGVDRNHKKLGERLAKARKLIGYESRADMLNAWGFEAKVSTGGRPSSFDMDALIADLTSRYKDREKPVSLATLEKENPDLKKQLKTAKNRATELFGRTLAVELRRRGLLAEKPKKEPAPAREKKRRASSDEKDAARNNRRRSCANVDNTELMKAVAEAREALCDLLPADKPRTLAELDAGFDYGVLVHEAVKRKLVTKDLLFKVGILRPTIDKYKEYTIRSAAVEELSSAVSNTLRKSHIMLDEPDGDKLPYHVCGVDFDNGVELRRVNMVVSIPTTPFGTVQLNCGDEYELTIDDYWFKRTDGHDLIHLEIGLSRPIVIDVSSLVFFDGLISQDDSVLSSSVGAKVLETFEHGTDRYAQFQLTYLASLRVETLVYLLRQKGIVRDSDFLGGMGWRYRLGLADFEAIGDCSA